MFECISTEASYLAGISNSNLRLLGEGREREREREGEREGEREREKEKEMLRGKPPLARCLVNQLKTSSDRLF